MMRFLSMITIPKPRSVQNSNLMLHSLVLNPTMHSRRAARGYRHNGHSSKSQLRPRTRGNRASVGFQWKPKIKPGAMTQENVEIENGKGDKMESETRIESADDSKSSTSSPPSTPIIEEGDEENESTPSNEYKIIHRDPRSRRNPSSRDFDRNDVNESESSFNPKHCRISEFEGIPIRIVFHHNSCDRAIHELMKTNPTWVGFDCEWAQHFKQSKGQRQRRVALIQIATEDMILLIRVGAFFGRHDQRKRTPHSVLLPFLRDDKVIKVGVGIEGDAQKLYRDYGMEMRGCVDLNNVLIREYGTGDQHITDYDMIGLQRMAKLVLNRDMNWKEKINHKLWESKRLSQQHIRYASDDSLTAFLIFKRLQMDQYHGMNPYQIVEPHLDQPFLRDIRVMTTLTKDAMEREQHAS